MPGLSLRRPGWPPWGRSEDMCWFTDGCVVVGVTGGDTVEDVRVDCVPGRLLFCVTSELGLVGAAGVLGALNGVPGPTVVVVVLPIGEVVFAEKIVMP